MAEQRWHVGVQVDDYMDYPHQTAQQVRELLARWGAGDDVTYVIIRCDCDLCDPPAAPDPDRCECGNYLVDSGPYRQVCQTCNKVYDAIPF